MREFVDEFTQSRRVPAATALSQQWGRHLQCHCEFPRLAHLYTESMRAEASAGVGLKPSDLLKPRRRLSTLASVQRATSGHLIQNIQSSVFIAAIRICNLSSTDCNVQEGVRFQGLDRVAMPNRRLNHQNQTPLTSE
jgi:hypothetical protein